MAVTDFDGDGKVDLVVSLGQDNKIAVLTGDQSGFFNMPTTYNVGTTPAGVAVADFDGDGRPDIATALNAEGNVAIQRNTNGVPGTPILLGNGNLSLPLGIAVGDLDNDGRPDVVVANSGGSSLSVFLNKSQ